MAIYMQGTVTIFVGNKWCLLIKKHYLRDDIWWGKQILGLQILGNIIGAKRVYADPLDWPASIVCYK